jgi:F420-0:gamma-glutamyl ligase
MSLTLSEYRTKLIEEILLASSQEEVKQIIDSAMEGLEDNEVVCNIVSTFADNIVYDLEQFDPLNKTAQQWSNINMARITFNRIKAINKHKVL